MSRSYNTPPKFENLSPSRKAALAECHVGFLREALSKFEAATARMWEAMGFAYRNGMDDVASDDAWLARQLDELFAEYKKRLDRREDQANVLKGIAKREAERIDQLSADAGRMLREQAAQIDWSN